MGQNIPSTNAITTTLTGLTDGAANYNIAVRSAAADGRLSLPFGPQTAVSMLRLCALQRCAIARC